MNENVKNIGGNINNVLYERFYNVRVKNKRKEYSHETF